jgi:6-phosphogluconolactonase (cycloisomerase 2 family)
MINRRQFLGRALAGSAVCALSSRSKAATSGSCFAYAGSYTPNGGGIYLFSMDYASGALTQLHVFDGIKNPSWLVVNSARNCLYAVSEIDDYEGEHSGGVVAYGIEAETMRLKRIGGVSSGGGSPAHMSLHPSGKYAFVANYVGGNVAVLPIDANGALGAPTDVRPGVGARHHPRAVDDPAGQFAISDHAGAHPHMIACDPSGQFVIANDAGLDLTLVWKFDAAVGRLLPAQTPVVPAPSGSAPRHFVFHPNGRNFYNLYEHDAKIAVYDYDARGGFKHRQLISTLPAKFAGSDLSSGIVISADGKFLYAANRLHSAVAVFAVGDDGLLRSAGEHWTHADFPRSISIDPSGQYLYACNQRGDSITSFRINAATGTLSFTGRFEPVGSPAVLTFVPAA